MMSSSRTSSFPSLKTEFNPVRRSDVALSLILLIASSTFSLPGFAAESGFFSAPVADSAVSPSTQKQNAVIPSKRIRVLSL
jgi:hypothetical protein